jgi:hypothetical protein
LSAVCDCLFNIFAAIFHIQDAPRRGDRDPLNAEHSLYRDPLITEHPQYRNPFITDHSQYRDPLIAEHPNTGTHLSRSTPNTGTHLSRSTPIQGPTYRGAPLYIDPLITEHPQYQSNITSNDLIGNRVGYARTNLIGSRTSFVIASVRSSIH